MPNEHRHEHGVPGQPHLQFVTQIELNQALQPIIDLANEAIAQSGQKSNQMANLTQVVFATQQTVSSNLDRITVLENQVNDLQDRVAVLEAAVANQQEQIDALGLLFS